MSPGTCCPATCSEGAAWTSTSPCFSSCPGLLGSRAMAGGLECPGLGQLWGPPQVLAGSPAQCPVPRCSRQWQHHSGTRPRWLLPGRELHDCRARGVELRSCFTRPWHSTEAVESKAMALGSPWLEAWKSPSSFGWPWGHILGVAGRRALPAPARMPCCRGALGAAPGMLHPAEGGSDLSARMQAAGELSQLPPTQRPFRMDGESEAGQGL